MIILEGEEKKLKAFLKKESLHMKRNGIEMVDNKKESVSQRKEDSLSNEPKKRGPKSKK